jgi:hypothetical protein
MHCVVGGCSNILYMYIRKSEHAYNVLHPLAETDTITHLQPNSLHVAGLWIKFCFCFTHKITKIGLAMLWLVSDNI